jgi:hypothetical protein
VDDDDVERILKSYGWVDDCGWQGCKLRLSDGDNYFDIGYVIHNDLESLLAAVKVSMMLSVDNIDHLSV